MPDHSRRSPARLLAPLALVACAAAIFVVVAGAGTDDAKKKPAASAEQKDTGTTSTTTAPKPKQKATYSVKAGDTLGGIAEQTGVSVERLQELNPELDPQTLVSGQKIKLRE